MRTCPVGGGADVKVHKDARRAVQRAGGAGTHAHSRQVRARRRTGPAALVKIHTPDLAVGGRLVA